VGEEVGDDVGVEVEVPVGVRGACLAISLRTAPCAVACEPPGCANSNNPTNTTPQSSTNPSLGITQAVWPPGIGTLAFPMLLSPGVGRLPALCNGAYLFQRVPY